jgi:outer membrane protein TolC
MRSRSCWRLVGVGACAGLILATLPAPGQESARPRPYSPAATRQAAPPADPAPDPTPPAGRRASYPIDLPTALRLVDGNNPTVGVARARVREAVAQLDRARLNWIPTLSFGPTFFYHQGIDQNRRGDTFIVSRGNYTLGAGPTLRVDVSDALYLPLVARQGVRAAGAQARATAYTVQLEVALAYLDLVELHGLITINADILARTEQILRAAEVGARAGRNKTAADVNRAAAELNLRREEGLALRGRAAAAAARLTRLLALDPAVELTPYEVAVVPLILVPAELTLEQLIRAGLTARPEVAAAQAAVAASDALVRQARLAPLLPRVQADFIAGGLGGWRDSPDPRSSPFMGQYNTGVAAVWNLEAFGLGNAAAIRARRAGYEASLYRLREVQTAVSSQVVEAAETAAARFEALDSAQEAVRQAEEMHRKFREASFALTGPKGQLQLDALETLTAVQALNAARVQYLQQVVEFNRAQFRLFAAIGQPPSCGLDTAVPHPVAVPTVPPAPAPADGNPLPPPRPAPAPANR